MLPRNAERTWDICWSLRHAHRRSVGIFTFLKAQPQVDRSWIYSLDLDQCDVRAPLRPIRSHRHRRLGILNVYEYRLARPCRKVSKLQSAQVHGFVSIPHGPPSPIRKEAIQLILTLLSHQRHNPQICGHDALIQGTDDICAVRGAFRSTLLPVSSGHGLRTPLTSYICTCLTMAPDNAAAIRP